MRAGPIKHMREMGKNYGNFSDIAEGMGLGAFTKKDEATKVTNTEEERHEATSTESNEANASEE